MTKAVGNRGRHNVSGRECDGGDAKKKIKKNKKIKNTEQAVFGLVERLLADNAKKTMPARVDLAG